MNLKILAMTKVSVNLTHKTRIFQDNWVNITAADALAPCITRPSATIEFTVQDQESLSSTYKDFNCPAQSHCWEMIENANIFRVSKNNLGWLDLWEGYQGVDSIYRCHPASIGNPIKEIRQSYDRLISTMGFPILVRWHLYIESGPRIVFPMMAHLFVLSELT